MPYAELHCRSYFSFLDGASPPEDLVERACHLGYRGIAVTDVDGVYALPRAHLAAKQLETPLLAGCELTVADSEDDARPTRTAQVKRRSAVYARPEDEEIVEGTGPELPPGPPGGPGFRPAGRIVLVALDGQGWTRLCRLVTSGRMRHPKGRACVPWDELAADTRGLVGLSGGTQGPIDRALAGRDLAEARRWAVRLRDAFGERAHMELTHHLRPGDDERLEVLDRLARELRMARVVTQEARYATPERRVIHDVQTCVRHGTTLAAAGRLLAANGEAHLAPLAELERRFAAYPDALERSAEIAAQARFSLDELRYRFPAAQLPEGLTPDLYLYDLTMAGAQRRYQPVTARVKAQLARELQLIEKLKLAGYFLIVWDIVRFCRERQILCQGRGSAANSAVCYALDITAVDPIGMELLFERFLSEERNGGTRTEMPDIDLDIAHQRREEVIQYVYQRYGRASAAMANEVISYRTRSAIRDVGKAFGLSLAQIDAAAKACDRFEPDGQTEEPKWSAEARARSLGGRSGKIGDLDVTDPTVIKVVQVAQMFDGFPRHLGIHSGGMVLAEGVLADSVPIENATMPGRSVVQWDKDDLNGLGIIKIDLLGLGMLTAIDDGIRLVNAYHGTTYELATIPTEDPAVYEMISRADTVGVFQIESRAQMSMLPRLKPKKFYDLVIEVAIIRPGPIQGDMVHPYLRRRNGEEEIEYAHPSLEPVLARTLGVPLFQEQGMKLAVVAAGFTAGEADELRRAMGHKRSRERMAAIKARLTEGMQRNGISGEVAERIFRELSGFADYGFPESHAASFALLVYASAWIKRHHPAAFCAALLNAQPMGFYAPHTLVSDARRHGVTVLPACARRSAWTATLEPDPARPEAAAVRLGIASVRGAGDAPAAHFEAARQRAPFRSVGDFARRSRLPRQVIERLAAAGGFAGFGLSRREALWQVAALPGAESPLWRATGADSLPEADDAVAARVELPAMDAREELAADFIGLGLSIERNPVALVREALDRLGVRRATELNESTRNGQKAMVAGMVICRQRPATAKGMVFMTLEDETGLANLVLTPDVFEKIRARARDLPLVVARGKVERQGLVVNLRVEDMAGLEQVARTAPAPPVPVAASPDLAEAAARVQPPRLPHVAPRNFR